MGNNIDDNLCNFIVPQTPTILEHCELLPAHCSCTLEHKNMDQIPVITAMVVFRGIGY